MDRQKSIAIRKVLDQIGMKHNLKGARIYNQRNRESA